MSIQIPKGDNLGWGMPQARRTIIQGGDDPIGQTLLRSGRDLGALGININKEQQQKQEQEKNSLDRVAMANNAMDYQKEINLIIKDANDKVNAGKLQPEQIKDYVSSSLSKVNLSKYTPPNLSEANQALFNLHLKELDNSAGIQAERLQEKGIGQKAKTTINQYINNANEAGMPPDQFMASTKSDDFKRTASLVWGISAPEQIDNINRKYTVDYLQNQTIAASDKGNYKALRQLRADANNPDFYKGVLQQDDRVRLGHQAKQFMKSIENEWKAAQAERLVNLQYKIQDDSAKVEAGLDVPDPLTAEQIRSARPSNPASAERFDRQIDNYKLTLELQPILSKVIMAEPLEAQKAIAAIKPTENDNNFAFKQQRYNFVLAKYQQAVKAREADPAAWFIQYNEPVQKAYQAFAQDPSKGADFLQSVEAQKQIYGIRNNDILPKAMANNLLDKIENGKDSSIFDIQSLGLQFGSFANKAVAQIQKDGSSAVRVLMGAEDPIARMRVYRLRHVRTSDLAKNISKFDKDSADKTIQSNFSPALNTFIRQGAGLQTINDVMEQATKLVYEDIAKGVNPNKAAEDAYKRLIGSQYTFNDTWRLPTKLNLDNDDVQKGAKHFKDSLKVDDISDISIYGDSRLSLNTSKREALQAIKDKGQWVTSPDETGLVLTLNGLAVADKNNQPITIPFSRLAELGMNNRSNWGAFKHWARQESKYTPQKRTVEEKEAYKSDTVSAFTSYVGDSK